MKLLFPILFLISTAVVGQALKSVTFEEPSHDFGTIKEIDGSAEFDFIFKNTGLDSVKIINVRASCGCTTPAWTKEFLAPGEKGFIKASYNPRNRPGPFNKTLTVTTSERVNNMTILRISGQVKPKPRTVEDDLPTLLGGIRVKYRAFNMGKVLTNQVATKEFEVYNATENPIVFNKVMEGPSYITISFSSDTLAPKEKGKIMIAYDGAQKNELGFMSENIVFTTNEEGDDARKSMSVYADMQEYFPPMSEEEKQNAPSLLIENSTHNFGTIAMGSIVTTTFILANAGKTALSIRKIKSSCGCAVPQVEKTDLKPGESVKLKVTFNSAGRKGTQIKTVTVYSNDPLRPIQKVTVKSKVVP